MLPTLYVIVCGSPLDGINIHGPFAYMEMAQIWAEDNIHGDWWATTLCSPEA